MTDNPKLALGLCLIWIAVVGLVFITVEVVKAKLANRRRPKHRGEYVEKPEWKPEPKPLFLGSQTVTLFITPGRAPLTLPPLIGAGDPPPVLTMEDINGRIGEFGDSAFDRTDATPLCGPVEVEGFGGGWWPIGTIATDE